VLSLVCFGTVLQVDVNNFVILHVPYFIGISVRFATGVQGLTPPPLVDDNPSLVTKNSGLEGRLRQYIIYLYLFSEQ